MFVTKYLEKRKRHLNCQQGQGFYFTVILHTGDE